MLWWRSKPNPSPQGIQAEGRPSNVAQRTRSVPYEDDDDDTEEDEQMLSADGQAQAVAREEAQQGLEEVQQAAQAPTYETCREELDLQDLYEQQDPKFEGSGQQQHHNDKQQEPVHHQQHQPHTSAHAGPSRQLQQLEHQVDAQQLEGWEEEDDTTQGAGAASLDDRQPYWHKTGSLILPLPEGLPSEASVRMELNGVMLPPAATEKVKLVHTEQQGWGKVGPLRPIKPLIEGAEQVVCCTHQDDEGGAAGLLLQVQWAHPSASQLKGYIDRGAYSKRPAVVAHASHSSGAVYVGRRTLEALTLLVHQVTQPLPSTETEVKPAMTAVELDGVFIPFQACTLFKRSPKGSSWFLTGFPGFSSLVTGARVTGIELLLPVAPAAPASAGATSAQHAGGAGGLVAGDMPHGMATGLLVLKAQTISTVEGAQPPAAQRAIPAQPKQTKQVKQQQQRQSGLHELWQQQTGQQPAIQQGHGQQQKGRGTHQPSLAGHVGQQQHAELARENSISVQSQQPSDVNVDHDQEITSPCRREEAAGPSRGPTLDTTSDRAVGGYAQAVGEAEQEVAQDTSGANTGSRETSPNWQEEGIERATNSDMVPHWDKSGSSLLVALPQGVQPGISPVRLEINGALLPAVATENIQLQRQRGDLTKIVLNRANVWIEGAQLLMCSTLEGEEGGATALVLRVHWPPSKLGQKGGFYAQAHGERKRCTGSGIQTTIATGVQMHLKVVSALGLEPGMRCMTAVQRDDVLVPLQQPTHLHHSNGSNGSYYCRIKGLAGFHRLAEGCKVVALERWMPASGPNTAEGVDGQQYAAGLLVVHLATKDQCAPSGTTVQGQAGVTGRTDAGERPLKRAKLSASLTVAGNGCEQGGAAAQAPAAEAEHEEEHAQVDTTDEGAEQQEPSGQPAAPQPPPRDSSGAAKGARAPAQHAQRPAIPKPRTAPAGQLLKKAAQRQSGGGSSSDDTRVTGEVPAQETGQAGAPLNALPELELSRDASMDANTRRLITRALLPAIKLVASTPAARSAANLKLLEVGDQDLLTFVLGGSYDVLRDAVADGGQDEWMLRLARELLGRLVGQQL